MGSIDDRFARFIGHEQSQDIALDTRAQLVEKALLFDRSQTNDYQLPSES